MLNYSMNTPCFRRKIIIVGVKIKVIVAKFRNISSIAHSQKNFIYLHRI
jgi:hypothetical protein